MSALKEQVGGDHYKNVKIQPFEYSEANHLSPLEHTIIKYVFRAREKGGMQDLDKAEHCIRLLIELAKVKGNLPVNTHECVHTSTEFCKQRKELSLHDWMVIDYVTYWRYWAYCKGKAKKSRRFDMLNSALVAIAKSKEALQSELDAKEFEEFLEAEQSGFWYKVRKFLQFTIG